MTNKEIEERTAVIAESEIAKLNIEGLELYDTEYIKEGSELYLRVFIDKPGGVTIDDCVALTHPMNEVLDRESFINDAYIFEVSSPGLGRPLKKDRDFEKNIGKAIEIKLFAPVDGGKEFEGILKEFSEDEFVVDTGKKEMVFDRKKTAMVRQKIEF